MMRALYSVIIAFAFPGMLEIASAGSKADYVFTNGRIYTVSISQPWAEAVAIKGNKIVYVGNNKDAKKYEGPNTEHIDLGNRLVLPGFIDSHIHVMLGAATSSGITIEMSDTLDIVLRKVEDYAKQNPKKKALFGASYNAFLFDDRGPDRAVLDKVVSNRPVFLMDHTLHSVWVNSKALEMAGITRETPNPPGGEYVRGNDGELTGFIRGSPASIPVLLGIGAITAESILATLPKILEGLSEFGFTAAIDMGNPIATDIGFKAVIDLDRKNKLPLRLAMTHIVNTPAGAETAKKLQVHYSKKYRSKNVWLDSLKIMSDSVIENQKAALLDPYSHNGNLARPYFTNAQLEKLVFDAAAVGDGVVVHALGDAAVRQTLDTAEVLRRSGNQKTRLSATHAQIVAMEDRNRFGKLKVFVQTTANWANYQPDYISLLGEARNNTLQFPFRSWVDSGAVVALGADWPATPGGFKYGQNPFVNIYTAMHRRVPKTLIAEFGSADRILEPANEVLTLAEAIQGYTINGAKMMGRDKEIGSIEIGKRADMILLDQNIFEIPADKIPETRVLATMFDGKIVHDLIYGMGDDKLIDLNVVGAGAVGVCQHGYSYHKH